MRRISFGVPMTVVVTRTVKDDTLRDIGVLILWACVIAGGMWFGYLMLTRRSPEQISSAPKANTALTEVVGHTFQNATVVVDGKRFRNCTLVNCTIRWNGGPFFLDTVHVGGPKRFETQSPQITETIDLLKALGFLETEFAGSWEHKPAEYFSVGQVPV